MHVNVFAHRVRYGDRAARLAIVQDVTARLAVEAKRRETEAQYRAMFEAQADAVLIVNRDGCIVDANPAACETYGYRCEDLKGRRVQDLIGPDHRHIFDEAREAVARGEPYHNQSIDLTSSGRSFHTDVRITGIRYEGKPHALVVVRDITTLKDAEEAIRQSGQSLREVIDNVSTCIMVIDPADHTIRDVNTAASHLVGLSKQEIIGRQCYDFLCPNQAGNCPITDKNEVLDHSERVLVTADGRELPVLKTVTTINLMGRPMLLESFVDIRQLKQVETRLVDALRDLRAKNEELEAFVYSAAHDLRTPLVSVIGFLDLLKGELSGKLDREQEYMLRRVMANTLHFDNLLKDLLVFSQSGVRESKRDQVRISTLVERVVEEEDVGRMTQPVEISVAPNLPDLSIPVTRAYQVFKNLISNSLKFGQDGAPLKIEVGMVEDGDGVPDGFAMFYVRDNGIGIEKKLQQEVFKLFFRSRKHDSDSTGVGLAIVKRIVESEGGQVRLDSDRGQGATFLFSLPVIPPPDD